MKSQDKDMSANKGTFIAILLCVGLYLAWNQYLQKKYPGFGERKLNTPTAATTDTSATGALPAPTEATPAAAPATVTPDAPQIKSMPSSDLTVDTKDVTFTFSQELVRVDRTQLRFHSKATASTIRATARWSSYSKAREPCRPTPLLAPQRQARSRSRASVPLMASSSAAWTARGKSPSNGHCQKKATSESSPLASPIRPRRQRP